jgi:hypothetical protein
MEKLKMSLKERIRLEALGRVKRKEITLVAAADLACTSVRQMRRMWKRYQLHGAGGLVHRLRGKPANNRIEDEQRLAILELYRTRYSDFGPTFACEKLAGHGFNLSPDTLSNILKQAGLWQARRKRSKHRSRRERRASFGHLMQMDGSDHDWFEGRSERCVLMVMIDDATNFTFARFYRRETLEAAFDIFERWVRARGLPRALYVDRAGIYRSDREPNGQELLEGRKPLTQFGRAMKELGVELILANSPQAKGRVERRNGLLQDRLVKEMRLAGIDTMQGGNAFLDKTFLAELNARYNLAARDPADAHRAVEPGTNLAEVLCEQELRVVGRDWCVRWENAYLQIGVEHEKLALPGKKVVVKHKRDGTLAVEHQGESLKWSAVKQRPEPVKEKEKHPIKNNKPWKPSKSHPWNR